MTSIAPSLPLEQTGPIRVLIAEDDSTQRMLFERMVHEAGYDVQSTDNGADALALVLEGQFDILVTDLEMPGINGRDLCQQIRRATPSPYLYILMLTALVQEDDVAAALTAGANDFVRKPPQKIELLARLQNATNIIQLLRKIERLSVTDQLSGVYNRGYLTDQLPREISRANRYSHPLAVIMADIDHFKQINDCYGHAVGDQVISAFSAQARAFTRDADWIARYGGEEFVLVLAETPLDQATEVAERIRLALSAVPLNTAAGQVSVTASFGVAELMVGTADSSDALLDRADKAMYESKGMGRDRVTVSRSPQPSISTTPVWNLPHRR